ncbi:hypothetical protein EP7_004224 [Isosphaeraceae bacterium EP7]
MLARRNRTAGRRRGVVLILILGMLGLMALIGVTFAAFAGQAQVGSRNFAAGVASANAEQMMDYALAQLINDTNNPLSALRGHSLGRDMYGNDSVMANGINNSLYKNYLEALPNGNFIRLQSVGTHPGGSPHPTLAGKIRYETNIPVGYTYPQLYGLNFTQWTARIQDPTGPYAAQTFEILEDDILSGANHILTLSVSDDQISKPLPHPTPHPTPGQNVGADRADNVPPTTLFNNNTNGLTQPTPPTLLAPPAPGVTFLSSPRDLSGAVNTAARVVLDGRRIRAFNGPGVSALSRTLADGITEINAGYYPNYRINGGLLKPLGTYAGVNAGGNPDAVGLDEDYDACDLENWFLAIQSADGKVVVPSFHRPGIIRVDNPGNLLNDDWMRRDVEAAARFLRPRQIDHPRSGLRNLYPDANNQITYDIDNDGDGTTDSVWLDLGFPPSRDLSGRLSKPLFAFLVLGLNGRMPLNTVGNLQARDSNAYDSPTGTNPVRYPANLPTFDHASHLGYSPSEINPKFALQVPYDPDPLVTMKYSLADNALDPNDLPLQLPVFPAPPIVPGRNYRGVPVWLTQLRNLLAGTRPQKDPQSTDFTANGDANLVYFNGATYAMPNGLFDNNDSIGTSAGIVNINTPAVPGRWGEAGFIPTALHNRVISVAGSSIPTNTPATVLNWIYPPARAGATWPGGTGMTFPLNHLNWMNPVRAGKSASPDAPHATDSTDDNYTAWDPYPYFQRGPNNSPPLSTPEYYNHLDNSGSLTLASERMRRFLTPVDVSGSGRVVRYDSPSPAKVGLTAADLGSDANWGADSYGRVGYFNYFRPPGLPGYEIQNGFSTWVAPPGLTNMADTATNGLGWPANTAARSTNLNVTGGFESRRIPGGINRRSMGRMPQDNTTAIQTAQGDAGLPQALTYLSQSLLLDYGSLRGISSVSSEPSIETITTRTGTYPDNYTVPPPSTTDSPMGSLADGLRMASVQYPMGSLGRDEADEMNLYLPTNVDSPYSVSDLEWLYRLHDTDGSSLTSRLAKLAPISFTNPDDGLTRRRLFSVDSWELTNAAWSPDNPVSSFHGAMGVPAFPNNSHFAPFANASVANFSGYQTPLSPVNLVDGSGVYPASETPSVAHADKKINLNFPLPISNDPDEPVRKKWIGETYKYMKMVLPPRAVDTPEELAELSQFLVNLVDFRDTDGACTHFANPDLKLVDARAISPPRVVFINDVIDPAVFSTRIFEQFGMEYNPIALNEVLAYRFEGKPSGVATSMTRLFIEVVNTLVETEPAGSADLTPSTDLRGWELLILPDNPAGRPNPVNGQLSIDPLAPALATNKIQGVPLSSLSRSPTAAAPLAQSIPPLASPVLNADNPGRYYYVIGRDPFDATGARIDPASVEHATPAVAPDAYLQPAPAATVNQDLFRQLDLIVDPANFVDAGTGPTLRTVPVAAERNFKWLYLLRPSNPFDPTSAKVVADCIRFAFTDTGGRANPVAMGTGMPLTTQRLQPFRGGHLISPIGPTAATTPAASGLTPFSPSDAYGYSEQTSSPSGTGDTRTGPIGSTGGTIRQVLGSSTDNPLNVATTPNTPLILSTLGAGNIPSDPNWERFTFLDRDFQSVAEILMVPVTPPGLFTKRFVENAPPALNVGAYSISNDPVPTAIPAVGLDAGQQFPRTTLADATNPDKIVALTFPYLSDKFFYTAASDAFHPGVNTDASTTRRTTGTQGGWTSAGWHRMLEFFDVPSPALGSIGLVQDGANFDWARQDLKPGMLNMNLIIDQEVFLGLLDNPNLDLSNALAPADGTTPRVVNQIGSALNYPNASFAMTSKYLVYPNDDDSYHKEGTTLVPLLPLVLPHSPEMGMTAAFSDFLKLRHGGSGYLFAFGTGVVGSGAAPTKTVTPSIVEANSRVAAERPFRSLSYPDIDYTVLRPATLPPNLLSLDATLQVPPLLSAPLVTTPAQGNTQPDFKVDGPASNYYTGDPGVKNPWVTPAVLPPNPAASFPAYRMLADLATSTSVVPNGNGSLVADATTNPLGTITTIVPSTGADFMRASITTSVNVTTTPPYNVPQPPPIPTRRLFAIADAPNPPGMIAPPTNKFPANRPPMYNSNAATKQIWTALGDNGQPEINQPILHPNLSNPLANLTASGRYETPTFNSRFLGGSDPTDRRQHPYFRTEMLQKVMNLTTVRTHQFAVWITVGFFQVVRPGNATFINPDPTYLPDVIAQPQPDELGPEIDLELGRNRRFRSFFVLDRTRLNGFNPGNPQDFRDVVTYRRRIE